MNEAQAINQISQLFLRGKYKEAEVLCAEIGTVSRNSKVFYLYGLCCYKNDDLLGSCAQFRRAVELNSADYDSLFNLAVACWELKQYEEALNIYRTLLAKAPHYIKALPNLAQALMKTGYYDEGYETFRKAIAADPGDLRCAALFMEFQCLYLLMRDRAVACEAVLSLPNISPTNKHTALIYRATTEWVAGNLPALEQSLNAAHAIPMQVNDEGYRNIVIYRTFLQKLLDYRKTHPDIYQPDAPLLYLAGDSHSLSYANATITWQGQLHKIQTHLIMGTQARHLSPSEPDAKKFALERYIKTLPTDATLLCAFGEIDCRTNHGILPYWQKQGGNLEDIVESIVAGYCRSVTTMVRESNINLGFLSVPAPHISSGDRRHVITLFNNVLRKHVTSSRHTFIDTYTPSQGSDGYAHGQLHIDNFHLKPEALQAILH